jgi:secreted trypsin-like serine protease
MCFALARALWPGRQRGAFPRSLIDNSLRSYPWAVLIDKIGGDPITCTGSIIAKKWVVTAAHCVLNNQENGYKSADRGTTLETNCYYLLGGSCRMARVKRHVPHPCYHPSYDQDHDDIVLFELEEEIEGIEPIKVDGIDGLPPWKVGSTVTLAGFGVVDNNNFHRSSFLMSVDVPLATEQKCEETNPSALRHGYINFTHVICTGGSAGKDSCAGDSGGPAVFKHEDENWLVGVLSIGSELPLYSMNCGIQGRYGVYTQVRKYSAWIKRTMDGGANTCDKCPCVGDYFSTTQAGGVDSGGRSSSTQGTGSDNTVSGAMRAVTIGVAAHLILAFTTVAVAVWASKLAP